MVTELEKKLFKALERMDKMHAMMMEQVNHRASAYDSVCIHEMNAAPLEAAQAMRLYQIKLAVK